MNTAIRDDKIRWNNVRSKQLRFVIAKRKCEKGFLPIRIVHKMIYKHLQNKNCCEIPSTVKIGNGFYIGHLGNIVIHKDTIIGKNVNILNGVLIGYQPRGIHKGVPTIGNQVWIGTNAIIVGKITIGNNVLIAPGAYVNFDVPDNSIVLGNPGEIHSSETATDGYCNNLC